MSTPTPGTGQRDTNVGFHPPAKTDAPATRSMFLIILFLLVVGTIIAVVVYNRYNPDQVDVAPRDQPIPPRVP